MYRTVSNESLKCTSASQISSDPVLMKPPRIKIFSSHIDNETQNGSPSIKKYSLTDSGISRTLSDITEEDRSWWYTFFLKCHSEDDEKPSWQPNHWSKLCPHPYCPTYRQFSRIISLGLIGVFSWCVLYSIVGKTAAPPDGQLYQIILLSICAYLGGWLVGLTTLPNLVGMLSAGMLLQNMNIVNIDQSFTKLINELGHLALVVILIRAGLDLDPPAMGRLKYTVIKLSVIPWLAEAGTTAVLSKFLLQIPWDYAMLLGTIVAAVAPAVVVPCLFRLRAKGYGVSKGIPTLVIAVASIGDSTSVAVFGVIKSIIFSKESSFTSIIILGPLSIVGGIGFGILWGLLCSYIPERHDPFMTPLRILLLLAGGMVAVFGSELLGYGGAGPLGCVSAAFVALAFWSKQDWKVEDNPAATAFEIFWMICQPILFGIAGARIKFNELDGSVVLIGVGIVIAGVLTRMIITTLVGIGCKLNLKEKIFVSITWMCKAIVQAALGPVALTMVAPGTDEYIYAEKILTTCVLSIIITVPTGALLTTWLGPRFLTKAKPPSLLDLARRKSRRPSIRDISIIEEEEEDRKEEPVDSNHLQVNSSAINIL